MKNKDILLDSQTIIAIRFGSAKKKNMQLKLRITKNIKK